MNFDLGNTLDSIKDGTREIVETAHEKTSAFHENYVSKVLPDCGKYGDAAKFVAEMAPGVSEYNAIVDGDWTGFAIAAGIDISAVAIGAFTAGAGYAAVKGGTTLAKTGAKVAVKEVAEAGAKKVVKEVAEEGVEKVVKETVEAGAEKIVKEVTEEGVEKAVKEVSEQGVEKVVKETVESGVEKAAKEVAGEGTEKAVKETVESGAEKTVKEVVEESAEGTDNVVKRYLECRNKGLEGTKHPVTGVEFERRIVDDGAGELVEGVFPKFDSLADIKLPNELYKESNFKQFKEANRQLLDQIDNNPGLKEKFSPEQIEQIMDGITTGRAPDGFVWHHNEESGILQLVDEFLHTNTGHTAGRAIWGGGY